MCSSFAVDPRQASDSSTTQQNLGKLTGSQLYIENMDIGAFKLLLNLHLSGPVALDTNRSPVALTPMRVSRMLCDPVSFCAASWTRFVHSTVTLK